MKLHLITLYDIVRMYSVINCNIIFSTYICYIREFFKKKKIIFLSDIPQASTIKLVPPPFVNSLTISVFYLGLPKWKL